MEKDSYQEFYLEHQRQKAELLNDARKDGRTFLDVLCNRRSQRVFTTRRVETGTLVHILSYANLAPSSCNRQAVWIELIGDRQRIKSLSLYLVGGKDWLSDAPCVLLLHADMLAYKSPAERDFMPYLDIGVMVQTLYLVTEDIGLGGCYVNPNIKPENLERFKEAFPQRDSFLFGGAFALGHYDLKALVPLQRASVQWKENQ